MVGFAGFLVDSYLDWAVGEGIPLFEDFGLDLLQVETAPWPRMGGDARGAFVHLKGRGDLVNGGGDCPPPHRLSVGGSSAASDGAGDWLPVRVHDRFVVL